MTLYHSAKWKTRLAALGYPTGSDADNDAALRHMTTHNMTPTQISQAIGINRPAVVTHLIRLGLYTPNSYTRPRTCRSGYGKRITWEDYHLTYTEWELLTNIPSKHLRARIEKDRWKVEDALTTPTHTQTESLSDERQQNLTRLRQQLAIWYPYIQARQKLLEHDHQTKEYLTELQHLLDQIHHYKQSLYTRLYDNPTEKAVLIPMRLVHQLEQLAQGGTP